MLSPAGSATRVVGFLRDGKHDGPAVAAVDFGEVCSGKWFEHSLTQ